MQNIPTSAGEWWRSAIIYQVYVQSFADSNGDGIGDLRGIAGKLQYLKELGVDAIWLTPFYPSPLYDTGYDNSDHCAVDPRYGTLADYDELVDSAHSHGLRILIDIVPTYTAITHPWFQSALADPNGPHREMYYFAHPAEDGGVPNNWRTMFGSEPAWTPDEHGQYYLHIFTPQQPWLQWDSPKVHEAFRDVLRFWLDRGTDGFRIDVADHLYVRRGHPDRPVEAIDDPTKLYPTFGYGDQEETHEVYRDWRRITEGYEGDRYLIGEIALPPDRLARYVRQDELHAAFNLGAMRTGWGADVIAEMIEASLGPLRGTGSSPSWVLSNHDIIRHVSRYGGGQMGLRRARAAFLLLMGLPGSVYIYQGDELGLEEVFDLPDDVRQDPIFIRSAGAKLGRDGCRVPLPWEPSGPSLGFSTGEPWLPMPASWGALAASKQRDDPHSMLSYYKKVGSERRSFAASLTVDVESVPSPSGCCIFSRRGAEKSLLVVLNASEEKVNIDVGGSLLIASSSEAEVVNGVLAIGSDTTAWVSC